MDRTDLLVASQAALGEIAPRVGELIGSQRDLDLPAHGDGGWTARQVAVHLGVGPNVYAEIARGVPSPARDARLEDLPELSDALLADVAETDPGKLATLYTDSVEKFLRVTAGRPGDTVAPWHFGIDLDIATLAAILVSEAALHGYDIAQAVGAPWWIDPGHALLGLSAFAPLMGLIVGPGAAGHTAAYGLELRGGPAFTVRFTDGTLAVDPPGGDVDCTISADPVAFLMTFSGRMPRWPAYALGLITAGGPRPELAPGFQDLFVFP